MSDYTPNVRNIMILGCPVNEKHPLAYSTCKRVCDAPILKSDDNSLSVKATLTDFPLVYSKIDEMIRNGLGDGVDAVVMVGIWTVGGNTDVLIQRGAGRLGYRRLQPDSDGKFPSYEEDGKLGMPGDQETYETRVNVDKIIQRLQVAGFKNCRANDTREVRPEEEKFGKWICEYLYCALLQKFHASKLPVVLVELPAVKEAGGPYDQDETEEVVKRIVLSVAESV